MAAAITHALLTAVLGWRSDEVIRQSEPAAPGPEPTDCIAAFLIGASTGRGRCVVAIACPGAIPVRQKGRCLAMRAAAQRARVLGAGHAGVCDGGLLYVEDDDGAERRARLRVWLGQTSAPGELWWATPMGLSQRVTPLQTALPFPPGPAAGLAEGIAGADGGGGAPTAAGARLHPRLQLPAGCFAFVGDPMRPTTWKLPYRRADGRADLRRLIAAAHHAAASLATPFKGGMPFGELPVVIHRLADAARELGQLPPGNGHPSGVFQRLAAAERRCDGVLAPRLGPTAAPTSRAAALSGLRREASGI